MGPSPVATAPAEVVLMKSRRVTRLLAIGNPPFST